MLILPRSVFASGWLVDYACSANLHRSELGLGKMFSLFLGAASAKECASSGYSFRRDSLRSKSRRPDRQFLSS